MSWNFGAEVKVGTVQFRAFGPGPNFQFVDSDVNLVGTSNLNIQGSGGIINAGAMTIAGPLTFTIAASMIVPGATSLSLRNHANTQDNLLVLNSGATTITGQDGSGSGVAGAGHTIITGAGGGGNANGGNLSITLGAETGSGTPGLVLINALTTSLTATFFQVNQNGVILAHVNPNGFGVIGDGASQHPHVAVQFDTAQTASVQLRQNTTAMSEIISFSNTGGSPGLLLSCPDDLYVRPGSVNAVETGSKVFRIRSTSGTSFETWSGTSGLVVSNTGDFTWPKESDHTLTVSNSTTGGAAGGSIILHPASGNGAGITGSVIINNGNLVVGASAINNTVGIWVSTTGLTSVTQRAIGGDAVFTSAGTTEGTQYWGRVHTAASAYTLASGAVFRASTPSMGASSVVTNSVGMWIDNQGHAQITNSFGIFIGSQSGSGTKSWAFQSAAGAHRIGDSTATLGFYGHADIAQAVLATGGGATVDQVITALQNLGLVKQA